jgi:nucleoside phosphorylase
MTKNICVQAQQSATIDCYSSVRYIRNLSPYAPGSLSAMFKHEDYRVAWICPMPIELAAAKAMLDEYHPPLSCPGDNNSYEFGRIGEHNVVIASLPNGQFSPCSAAVVATELKRSFGFARIGLLAGICGGIPTPENDIRLGDVVISKPGRGHGGVVQYDLGRSLPDGQFERTGFLNTPPTLLLTALTRLQARAENRGYEFVRYLQVPLVDEEPRYKCPGVARDKLFHEDYSHVDSKDKSCEKCLPTHLVPRSDRKSTAPKLHYGNIGSGGSIVSDVSIRKRLEAELGILGVETEAAGLMSDFPCLVIRGVSDYCDSHKNKVWNRYASLVAAAVAKEILTMINTQQIPPLVPIAAPSVSESFLVFSSHSIPNESAGLGYLICDPCSPWNDFCPLEESLSASDVAVTPQKFVVDLLDGSRGTRVNERITNAVNASMTGGDHMERSEDEREESYFLLNSGNYFRKRCAWKAVQEFCERSLMYDFDLYMVVALRTIQIATNISTGDIKDMKSAVDLKTGCLGQEAEIVAIQYRKVGCKTTLTDGNQMYLEGGSNTWVHSRHRNSGDGITVEVVEGDLDEKVSLGELFQGHDVDVVEDQFVIVV